jgi:hypothetical protein
MADGRSLEAGPGRHDPYRYLQILVNRNTMTEPASEEILTELLHIGIPGRSVGLASRIIFGIDQS